MMFDIEKRIFVVKSYNKSESLVTVRHAFKKRFNTRILPTNPSILAIIKTFEKTGAVCHIPEVFSKKRLEVIEPVENLITEFPSLSIASAVGVSTKIVQTILSDDLHLKP